MTKLPINEKLEEIFIMSYFHEGELISKCILVYFKFSNDCLYEINIIDGISRFKRIDKIENSNGNIDDYWYYPINAFKEIDLTKLGFLIEIREFFWLGYQDESCGFVFIFNNGYCLYVIEIEEDMVLTEKSDLIPEEWRSVSLK